MSKGYTAIHMNLQGEHFEILVKSEKAFNYRLGKTKLLSEVLVSDTIFTDASKGSKAAAQKLQKVFGTTDPLKIAEIILRKGTLRLTTQQRRRLVEVKKRQIISFISRQYVDPKTNLPHPPLRVEQALGYIHYVIDPFKNVSEQARDIIKLLRPFLPLKTDQVSVAVRIPPEYASRVHGAVKGFGEIRREEWQTDGFWFAIVEMPAGIYTSFLDRLGELTKGNLEVKSIA